MTPILVVGGAGYVGSHTCLDLSNKGYLPITYDNLSNGHAEFARWGPLEVGDIADKTRLDEVISTYRPAAVIHFAALIEVGQSVADPLAFYRNNVGGTLSLLAAMERGGVDKIAFSSTCATYGTPLSLPIPESHPQTPINPYGRSKLMVERVLTDCAAHRGLKPVILRYFNAAGADSEARIGEWHTPETHAIPIAIDVALGRRERFTVNGSDYDTRDGTCVRDYVHVLDLADAHSRSIAHLLEGGEALTLNLGTGTGTTVGELIGAVEAVSGRSLEASIGPRREGDSPTLVADNGEAGRRLGWVPKQDLTNIIETAWNWHTRVNSVSV